MPKELEKKFEKEYMKKGYTKKQADLIFFKWESKHKKGCPHSIWHKKKSCEEVFKLKGGKK